MTAREGGEVKGIQGIAVQENGSTVVSSADTVNIVGGGTVTDVGGVATINIPQGVEWYREDVPAGSASYTFVNEPATDTSFLIFTDSGTLLFSGIDYTYNTSTHTVTFLSLDTNEAAYIWVAHANVLGGNVGDMVKAVYDPNNVQRNVYDYNYFINTPVVNTRMFNLSSTSDLTTAQDIVDWYVAGNNPIIYYNNSCYYLQHYQPSVQGVLRFMRPIVGGQSLESHSTSIQRELVLSFSYPGNQIASVYESTYTTNTYLSPLVDYAVPYMPLYDGSPATKKYVDDSVADKVEGPASSVDGNIAVFDGATGKLIKDSGLNIQVVNSQPTGLACTVFYDNGTIYLYTHQPSEILMENGNVITTEDGNPIILEN